VAAAGASVLAFGDVGKCGSEKRRNTTARSRDKPLGSQPHEAVTRQSGKFRPSAVCAGVTAGDASVLVFGDIGQCGSEKRRNKEARSPDKSLGSHLRETVERHGPKKGQKSRKPEINQFSKKPKIRGGLNIQHILNFEKT
jgi:hypothetical protein